MSSRAKARRQKITVATELFQAGVKRVNADPALGALSVGYCRDACTEYPRDGLARVDSNGRIHAHPSRRADSQEWYWAIAHCVLHLGFGHVPDAVGRREQPDEYERAARCAAVNRFQRTFMEGLMPERVPVDIPGTDEAELAQRWRRDGLPERFRHCGAAGTEPDLLLVTRPKGVTVVDWQTVFANALTRAVSIAVDEAGGRLDPDTGKPRAKRPWDRALEWFVSSYPLLGGIATGMTVVAEADLARAHDISVAAVNAEAGEIYVNPLITHTDEEWRFILAHEMLHAALRHADRCGARDPYLFNVAADYVINGWLVQMGVGEMPSGLLFDPSLDGLGAEEVYDRIAGDLRRLRRLATLRGKGRGDILGEPLATAPGDYVDLDGFYRRGLNQGLDLHRRQDRGLLPAGLVEEIRALNHPPIPWDARLARWFDEFVPRPRPLRSYARPSRRQASTPDIPRAGRYFPPEEIARCTFGVVLDTSGSMENRLLGKALGAIASYARSRDVPAARVVFCDAAPHDAGFLDVTEIAGRVRVRGRGGTVLQPGVDLLLRAEDFPATAPILVITDGDCDVLRIRREHAFLVPQGKTLPFRPRGPVFRVN